MKIATDVVLLPDAAMREYTIILSRELYKENKNMCLGQNAEPHLSLLQAVFDLSDHSIDNIITQIANETNPLELTAESITTGLNLKLTSIRTDLPKELVKLHERIATELKSYTGSKATARMFADSNKISKEIDWIDNFYENSAFDNFNPHINLGYGNLKNTASLPREFQGIKLGLYQLGPNGTCHTLLKTYDL